MGSNSSKGQKQISNENWKSFGRLGSRGKPKRGKSSTAELKSTPDNERNSLTCAHTLASTSATTHEDEKSDKRNSNSQRVLPSIPRSAKETNSDSTFPIRESAPLNNLRGFACVTHARRVTAPANFAQSSSYQADSGGADAATDYETEDPDKEYCPRKESVGSNLDGNGHRAEAPPLQDENDRNAMAPPENTYSAPVLRRKSSDATYMQISGQDLTDVSQADGMNGTSDDDDESPVENNEDEDVGVAQVLGDDYVDADFNLNMALVNALPKKTQQAIVGPSSGRRVHEDACPHVVQPGTHGALSGATGSAIQVKKTKAIILWKTEFAPKWGRTNLLVVLGCMEEVAQQKMIEKLRSSGKDGFQMLDEIEFDLFFDKRGSKVSVTIKKIQWMPDADITNEDLDTEEVELNHLWDQGISVAKFWQRFRIIDGARPEAFAGTIHVLQEDGQDMRTKILCRLQNPSLFHKQQHVHDGDYTVVERCDKPAKDFPGPPRSSASTCSECVSLHADSSVPEMKWKSCERQQKEPGAAERAKLSLPANDAHFCSQQVCL